MDGQPGSLARASAHRARVDLRLAYNRTVVFLRCRSDRDKFHLGVTGSGIPECRVPRQSKRVGDYVSCRERSIETQMARK